MKNEIPLFLHSLDYIRAKKERMEICENCHTGAICREVGGIKLCPRCFEYYCDLRKYGLRKEEIMDAQKKFDLRILVEYARYVNLNGRWLNGRND